jgi:exopolysaccharide production protein ExoZ
MNKSASSFTHGNKYETIQVLRFICALMVMFLHATFYTSERLDSGTFIYYQGFNGVKLFFIISGFVMIISSQNLINDKRGWKIFATKRIIRIVPIYWIITTYKVLVLIFASSLVFHARLDIVYILKSYFFIPTVNIDGKIQPFYAVGWTLNCEMFFYFLFTIALALRIRPIIFLGSILIPLSILSIFKTAAWPAVGFYTDPIILNFLYGMIAAQLIISGKKLPQNIAIPLVAILLVFIFLPRNGVFSSYNITNNDIVISIAAFLVIYGGASIENVWSKKIPNILIYLGGASYSLYLIHPSVAPFAPTLLKKLHLKFDLLSVVFAVIIATLVGVLFYQLCEKPITKFLTKRARASNLI